MRTRVNHYARVRSSRRAAARLFLIVIFNKPEYCDDIVKATRFGIRRKSAD